MSEGPLLSIVVPAFNEEAVIGRFIQSVKAEVSPLGITWEVLVVDDGSDDATVSIVREVARVDGRVRLLETAHRGKGAAVRQGFLASRGEWIFMADADCRCPGTTFTASSTSPPNNGRRRSSEAREKRLARNESAKRGARARLQRAGAAVCRARDLRLAVRIQDVER